MSAIFGIFNLSGEQVSSELLCRMSAAMAAHGTETGPAWMNDSTGLGQRMMCFTPEDRLDRQPLISADGRRVLVCDARIDNRRELRDALKLSSEEKKLTDSAYILRAYEKWGEECVHHLIGVFAFALWDARTKHLFLVRSPIAAPTLFYHSTPRGITFATMPSGLQALPYVPRAINEEKLADLLVESPASPSVTIYQSIYRLPTGHSLTAAHGVLKMRCFWKPDLRRQISFRQDEDYLAAFHEQLERVVKDHHRSISPVGIMLSGGLDSSAIAATSAQILQQKGNRLTAFTEAPRHGFDGPMPEGRYADETPFVRAITSMYDNLDLNIIDTEGRTFMDNLDRLFFHLEFPFRNTSNRVWIEAILQEARQRGIYVMLDGAQGNITLSWNGSGLLPSLLRRGKWTKALSEARAMARHGSARSIFRALAGQGIMPLLPAPLRTAIGLMRGSAGDYRPWSGWSPINPEFAAEQKVDERKREHELSSRHLFTPSSPSLRYEALASQDFGAYISAFRSMFGIDPRSPLADVRIAEFSLALPEDQYMRNGESRSLVRRAMSGRLPAEVLSNHKRGLQAADWFERSTSVRSEIEAELQRMEECELARRALNLRRMRSLVEDWPRGGWGETKVFAQYNYMLERGVMVGRFLRWIEESKGIRQPGP